MNRRRTRLPNFGAGIVGIVVIAVICYLVFGGSVPFTGSPFVLKALFTTDTNLHVASPVRIAGVNVGQVTSVQRVSGSSSAAVVTMSIANNGLPIHADATLNIRPRIFLEGNWYVDLEPGTPGAPVLSSGETLPAANTSGPVQLDRILSSLNSSARQNLQTLLQGIGATLTLPPTPAQDAAQDPSVRGLTAAQALNLSLKYSADAFKVSAIVNQALLGEQPHDLSQVVVGNEQIFRALASTGTQLASFVTTFNSTLAALAARQQDLSATIALLPPVLRATDSSDSALDASFGPTQEFAKEFLPSVQQLGPTIDAGIPWLNQANQLLSPNELGGLLHYLTPAVQQTASTAGETETFLRSSDELARCFNHNLIPTGDAVIQDPPVGTGEPVYQELFQSAVGLAGAAQNFDGNGRYIRSNPAGGAYRVQTQSLPQGSGPLYGNAVFPASSLHSRPAWPGQPPPLQQNVLCYQNSAPNLNNVTTGSGP